MLPMIELFGYTIYSYSFFWWLGFAIVFIASFFYNRSGVVGRINTISFIILYGLFIVAVIYGSKIMGFIANVLSSDEGIMVIFSEPMRSLEQYYGRNMFYGGMLAVILVCVIYCKIFKIPLKKISGIFAPFAALFIMFIRLGCFSAGCCYGVPFAFGNTFTHSASLAPIGVALFPTQLAEAAFGLVMCIVLIVLGRKQKEQNAYLGIPLLVFSYALFRFVLEFLRADVQRDILYLSLSQWISLALAVIIGIWYLKRKTKTPLDKPTQNE